MSEKHLKLLEEVLSENMSRVLKYKSVINAALDVYDVYSK